jgi:hypothetical protein
MGFRMSLIGCVKILHLGFKHALEGSLGVLTMIR